MTVLAAQACPAMDVLAFVPLALGVVAGLASVPVLAILRRPLGGATSAGLIALAVTTPLAVVAQLTVAC